MNIDLRPEERYLLDFDTCDLPRYATDVLVVGGGVAGLSAALGAAETGQVLVVLKGDEGASNTAQAQGGIAAAVAPQDSVEEHARDTIETGCGLADPAVVTAVTEAAPEAIERLVGLGARFDPSLGREGGHGRRRILHVGDETGRECDRALYEAVHAAPTIHTLPRVFVVDLLTADGRCVGVLARRRNGETLAIMARAVVLAAGGAGRLYRETSNVHGATGDGMAAAYRAGAALRDMEFVQFHPTTLYLAGSDRVLVTEAVRGERAHIVDDLGRRFVDELAPRDVVSRAIVRQLARPDVADVYLDMRHWPAGMATERFPGLVATCRRYGLDTEHSRIPVRPAAHYFIGGVACDLDGRTNLPGLFACGEAACSGMHGANRLASNSLLEGLVLGRRAGRAAAATRLDRFDGAVAHQTGRRRRADMDLEDLRESLVSRMWRSVGVLREAAGLEEAGAAIRRWRHFSGAVNLFGRAGFEVENLLLLGALVTAAAGVRNESRGTHHRIDFPETDARQTAHSHLQAETKDG